mgnify:CR=1 FL=1
MRGYKLQLINSSSYNKSLIRRGRIDFWMDKTIFTNWYYNGSRLRGGKQLYNDAVIELILMISHVYHLPLRQAQGFMMNLLEGKGIDLEVPNYTTLCRRRKTLDIGKKLSHWNQKESIVFSIDASGLKCSGEKEWMRKKHKATRVRKFIKIHTGINVDTRHIIFNKTTSSRKHDGTQFPDAIKQAGNKIKIILADGGYDFKSSFGLTHPDVKIIIPPRSNAIVDHNTHQRNTAIKHIEEHGRARWKREIGYHQRSLVENTFSRWKTIFGENISAKEENSQQVKATLKSIILNKMTDLGMPKWNRIYLLN